MAVAMESWKPLHSCVIENLFLKLLKLMVKSREAAQEVLDMRGQYFKDINERRYGACKSGFVPRRTNSRCSQI